MERLALVLLLIGSAGVLLAMFLGTGDVVGTQFFGWPVPGALEITESTMVLVVFGALAYAQIRNGHIRVELVYTHVRPRGQAAMDVLASVAAMVFFGLLAWQAYGEAVISWQIDETADGLIRFPLYPARWILVIGTALMIARLALDLVRDLGRVSGKTDPAPLAAAPLAPDIPGLGDDNE